MVIHPVATVAIDRTHLADRYRLHLAAMGVKAVIDTMRYRRQIIALHRIDANSGTKGRRAASTSSLEP